MSTVYESFETHTDGKLSPMMWANMVLELEKVGLDGRLLFLATDAELIEMHRTFFPVPFDTED